MSNLSQQLSPFLWIVLLSPKTYHLLHTTRLWKSFRSLFIKFCKNIKIFPVLSNSKPLQSLFLALEIKSFESDNHSVASWWQNLVNVAQGEAELYRFLTDFTVFIALLLFSPSITALFFVQFLMLFRQTKVRFSQSTLG